MYSILIVGTTGTGKTTSTKGIIQNFAALASGGVHVYDVNAEYSEYTKDNPPPSIEDFVETCRSKTNSIIVFEEATIFFSNRSSSEGIREILVRKRHKNNVIIFIFHSIRSIPKEITDLIDTLIISHTNDTKRVLLDKFGEIPDLLSAFDEVNKEKSFSRRIISLR